MTTRPTASQPAGGGGGATVAAPQGEDTDDASTPPSCGLEVRRGLWPAGCRAREQHGDDDRPSAVRD